MKLLRRFGTLLVLGLAILACDMSAVLPTPTPDRCAQARPYVEEILPILVRWQQTFQVGSSTARIALATPIMELQRIRNEFAAVEAPSHLKEQHLKALEAMDLDIQGFLFFQSSSGDVAESGAVVFFEEAARIRHEATALLDEAMAKCGLATPQAVPTASPTYTPEPAYLLTPTATVVQPSPTPTEMPTATATPSPIPPTPIPYGLWHERMTSAIGQADAWMSQIRDDMINNYQEQLSCPLAEQINDSSVSLAVDLFMTQQPDTWNCKRAGEELDWALANIGVATLSILDYCRYGDPVHLSVASSTLDEAREALSSAEQYYDMCRAQ